MYEKVERKAKYCGTNSEWWSPLGQAGDETFEHGQCSVLTWVVGSQACVLSLCIWPYVHNKFFWLYQILQNIKNRKKNEIPWLLLWSLKVIYPLHPPLLSSNRLYGPGSKMSSLKRPIEACKNPPTSHHSETGASTCPAPCQAVSHRLCLSLSNGLFAQPSWLHG